MWVLSSQRVPLLSQLALVFLAAGLVGCGGVNSELQNAPDSSITVVATLYGEFAMQHQGRGPNDRGEFVAFLQSLPEARRNAAGLGDLERFLASPRDQQPYVIRYGLKKVLGANATRGAIQGNPIVIHEAVGEDGLMYAANALGAVESLSAGQIQELR